MMYRNQLIGAREFSGEAAHDDHNYPFRVRGNGMPALQLTGASFQWATMFGRHVSLGANFEFAAGANPGGIIRQGMQELRPGAAVSVGVLGVAGLSAPVSRRLRLRAEVAFGVRFVWLGYQSTVGACVTGTSMSAHQLVVEPRGAAELFVTPWTSVGVTAGVNALEPGEVSAGLALRFYSHAWDGVAN